MAAIGQIQPLEIVKIVNFGAFLDGGEHGEILIPQRYLPDGSKIGDELTVFVYNDSEDRLIATTERPYACVGEFAYLKVVQTNKFGAFLNWGLPKDLLLPFVEQQHKVEENKSYIVRLYLDQSSQRIAASTRLERFLDIEPVDYQTGDEVKLLIAETTDMGVKAIVNNLHWGLLFKNELFKKLYRGQRCTGYIKQVREDHKIDLTLNRVGKEKLQDLSQTVLKTLTDNEGFLAITDKTDPKVIYSLFGTSKKAFKRTIGILYKEEKITLEPNGIRLKQKQSFNPWLKK